jgi:N-acetylglucosaminyldiphosphoundecaprenol N-acetyl-beta-D-mannosaminyltransferase
MLETGHLSFDIAGGRRWTIPVLRIGGLPIAAIDRANSAQLMIDLALNRRGSGLPPIVFTSANGQVLSLCARQSRIRDSFLDTDLIHADGMPLVLVSRLAHKTPLPGRVCTTDLFHDVAKIAPGRGARMFLLGATPAVIEEAARRMRELYPDLAIVGHASGYFRGAGDEERIIEAVNAAQPDILWLGLGAPIEQQFAVRHRDRLRGVGVIKTAGGLFDYLSGKNARAPRWMRAAGLEWAFRTYLEPRRLAGRYLATNPHALFLLLTRTALTSQQEAGKQTAPVTKGAAAP